MIFLGRESETRKLTSGISSTGTMRAALILGETGIGKSSILHSTGTSILDREPFCLWLAPSPNPSLTPAGWAVQLARDLQAGRLVKKDRLHTFAQEIGKQFATLPHSISDLTDEQLGSAFQKVAPKILESLERLISSHEETEPLPIFVFDDLDQYPKFILDWLANDFNQALRQSKYFSKSRFLFAAKDTSPTLVSFFEKFGFEQVHEFKLSGLSPSQSRDLFQSVSSNSISPEEIFEKTNGNPSKVLNLGAKRVTVNTSLTQKMSDREKNQPIEGHDFTDQEWSYLFCAIYPDRISRYSLEFFSTPKDAAFCYNWLKRSPKLATLEPNGDIILDVNLRKIIQKIHPEKNPEDAEQCEAFAFILNAFMGIFPDPNIHWIPINLQLFHTFTRKLCKSVFDIDMAESVGEFLNDYEHLLVIDGKQYTLNDDVKMVTQRFIEVGGGTPLAGLEDKIKLMWQEDLHKAKDKKLAMTQEKANLVAEEETAKKQILSLGQLKENLHGDSRKPTKMKPQKVYSVGTAPILIVLGIATIGSSLFSESIGSYYAATGIVMTLIGFFWPSVDTKKPAVAGGGNSTGLAIETQQRSLEHRISGLKNRVASMHGSIERLTAEIEQVDAAFRQPYFLEK